MDASGNMCCGGGGLCHQNTGRSGAGPRQTASFDVQAAVGTGALLFAAQLLGGKKLNAQCGEGVLTDGLDVDRD